MRILLISANREPFPEPVFPLGAVYVASALQNAGAQVRICDMRHMRFPSSLKREISRFRPERIGISLRNIDNAAYPFSRCYMPDYVDLVREVRAACDIPIILGGSAYSLFPCEIRERLGADGGVAGDGEAAASLFCQGIAPEARAEETGGRGEISFPRNIEEIFPSFRQYRTIGIQTGRGCPNRCIYCTYPSLEGRRKRTRHPESVADEIAFLRRDFGVRNFFIVDSLFNADEDHMVRVLEALAGMKLPVRLFCYLQPKITDPSIFPLLKEAGCVAVDFGTDSGSPPVLGSLRKPFAEEDIRKVSEACRAAGIDFCHSLIFGGPGETFRSIRETISLMDEVSPRAVVAMTGVRIYPGTVMSRIAQEEGLIRPGESLLEPRFYFPQMGAAALTGRVYEAVGERKNWFFPGRRDWSSTAGYRMLGMLYRRGPLWRTFSR